MAGTEPVHEEHRGIDQARDQDRTLVNVDTAEEVVANEDSLLVL
jgi:hypothetical protein